MRLLLDTHIFLWFINGDSRLPHTFREAIIDPDNVVFLSVVSIWEIVIKYQLGRLPLPESPEIYVRRQRELHLIESLPITESSLAHLTGLTNLHRDPFDRCLISQALGGEFIIVSVDDAVLSYDVPFLTK